MRCDGEGPQASALVLLRAPPWQAKKSYLWLVDVPVHP